MYRILVGKPFGSSYVKDQEGDESVSITIYSGEIG
jgi:hypothetical protein